MTITRWLKTRTPVKSLLINKRISNERFSKFSDRLMINWTQNYSRKRWNSLKRISLLTEANLRQVTQMVSLVRNKIKLVSRQDLQVLLEAVACRRVKRLSSKRWKILRNVSYKHSLELINNCRISESMSSGIECPKVRSRFMISKVRWMLSI